MVGFGSGSVKHERPLRPSFTCLKSLVSEFGCVAPLELLFDPAARLTSSGQSQEAQLLQANTLAWRSGAAQFPGLYMRNTDYKPPCRDI